MQFQKSSPTHFCDTPGERFKGFCVTFSPVGNHKIGSLQKCRAEVVCLGHNSALLRLVKILRLLLFMLQFYAANYLHSHTPEQPRSQTLLICLFRAGPSLIHPFLGRTFSTTETVLPVCDKFGWEPSWGKTIGMECL